MMEYYSAIKKKEIPYNVICSMEYYPAIKKQILYNVMGTVEYYSAIKKKEILLFGTTWMSLVDIMLCEINWTN